MKNKGLANKAAQNRLPGFRVLSQFFLQSISRCAILLYTGHKKHPVFLHRIVFFYRCDPHPSRGLQLYAVIAMPLSIADAIRAPHGDCNCPLLAVLLVDDSRCDPRPSRGLQLILNIDMLIPFFDAIRAPHGDCNVPVSWNFNPRLYDATRAPHGDCNFAAS